LNSAMIANVLAANAAIVTANTGVVSYVNTLNSAMTANVLAANAAIVTANTGVVSYVNTLNSAMTANVLAANAAIVTANTSMKAYVDTLNSAMTANVLAANAAIVTANTSMKAYVDAKGPGYGNTDVAAYLPIYPGVLNGTLSSTAQTSISQAGTLTGLTVSGYSVVSNTTQSFNSTTGAFTVEGGAGIAKDLHVGGSGNFHGDVLVGGNLIVLGNTATFNTENHTFEDSIINLHIDGNLTPLTSNDGRDVGHIFHYYDTEGSNSFLGRVNATGFLEWHAKGYEGVGNVFVSSAYGSFKTGEVIIANNTPAVSSLSGALRVSGGVGIQGNLYAGNVYATAAYLSANSFINGSQILTADALATVTFTANYITMNPAAVPVPAVGTATIYGTYNFGSLSDIQTYSDYNEIAQTGFYSVNDVAGAPGHIEYIGFTKVTDFNRVVLNINYTASSGHTQDIDIYNYSKDQWDTLGTYTGSGAWQTFTLGVINSASYISNTGNVTVRNYHLSPGATSHRTWIDYVALEKSYIGGQGPQGPKGSTGSTGATGPAGNITSFTSNTLTISNTTVSTDYTTGALVVTGGVGVAGNLNVGGNISTAYGLFWSNGVSAIYSNNQVAQYLSAGSDSTISAINANISAANAAIITANTGVVSYVNTLNSAMTANVQAANAAIITANTGVVSYVNTLNSAMTANVQAANAAIVTANTGVVSYVNTLNTAMIANVQAANAAIVTANTSMKAYVDSNSYGNTQAAAYLQIYSGSLGGTLSTASQTNITAVGTLTGLTVSGAVNITNATSSTSASTGALIVSGGIGVADNVYIGGNANITGNLITSSISTLPNTNANLLIDPSGSGDLVVSPATQVYIQDTQAATSPSTGALVVSGGVGIGGNLYVGGIISGSTSIAVRNISVNTVINSVNGIIFASGTITLTLPLASINTGNSMQFKNIGTGTVTVNCSGTDTIDNSATAVMSYFGTAIGVVSNGLNWYII